MPPAKKGKVKKAAVPPTREELDIQELQIRTEHAITTAADLRQQAIVRQEEASDARNAIVRQTEEVDEMYTYLDTQMLHSARERYDYERRYRQEVKDRAAEVAGLLHRLNNQSSQGVDTEIRLQRELDLATEELNGLAEFKGMRPSMEAEIGQLKQQLIEVNTH